MPAPTVSRTYAYQQLACFLTPGRRPLRHASWSYHRIGNRLTETRDSTTDVYAYTPNPGGGHTARLSQVTLGAGGSRTYQYTPAGHVEQVVNGGNTIDLGNDDAGQLSLLDRAAAETSTELAYDGRGFLHLALETVPNPGAGAGSASPPAGASAGLSFRGTPCTPIFADGFEGGDVCEWSSFVGIPDPGCPPDFLTSTVSAIYSSGGMLYTLERDAAPTACHVFYFGGRPVALRDLTGTTETWRWVTTDHLGTPIAATSTTGALLWCGGFEPFGRDFTTPSAQESGVFLRLPGQWFDAAWEESSLGAEVYYNVHRWYEQGPGRYTRTDPAGLLRSNLRLFGYAAQNPLRFADPNGLTTCVMISGDILAELGGLFYALGDHSALLIDGPCGSSGTCSSPGPLLYDPAGGYSAQHPGAGSAETLTREVPGWSRQGFFDYHCEARSDFVEVYCFETTCCEERQIEEQIPGGKRPGACALGVGEAARGIGPFAGLGRSDTPAILRRAMNRLLQQHSGAGATTWTHTCPPSADR